MVVLNFVFRLEQNAFLYVSYSIHKSLLIYTYYCSIMLKWTQMIYAKSYI